MRNVLRIFALFCLSVITMTCAKEEPENRDFDPAISCESTASINISEIGGDGLTLISSRDDDSPLSQGSFNTVVSKEGEQLLFVTDSKNDLRALTLSTPSSTNSSIMNIDAQSTAVSLIYFSPGILTIDAQEATAVIGKIVNLSSFDAFKSYLKSNLNTKSINEIVQESMYNTLLSDCVEEYYQQYINPSKNSLKGSTEEKNFFSVNTLANKQIELVNNGWRFVNVVQRDLNSTNTQNGSTNTVIPEMKGGIPLSWGTLFTWRVAKPTKDTITYLPQSNTSYTELWVVGPGLKPLTVSPPESIQSIDHAYLPTLLYYVAFPVFDLWAGSTNLTKSIDFNALVTSIKLTRSFTFAFNAAESNDIKAVTGELINVTIAIIKVAAKCLPASAGVAVAKLVAYSSIAFSGANLITFAIDLLRTESYAKYNIIPADGLPVVPTLLSPQSNSINISTPLTFTWNSVINASRYEIQVSKSSGFETIEYTRSDISINQVEIPLQTNTKYYWRLRSRNSNGNSAWSDIWSFTTASVSNTGANISEPFTGNTLNTNIWSIYDNTFIHEPGLDLKINDTLIITRGATNDNNMFYGIVTKEQFSGVTEASVDVWLSSLHNWQDHKVAFSTPMGAIGYYNYEGKWFAHYVTKAGVSKYYWFATGYSPDIKYSLKIRISGNELVFEWDKGSGFTKVFSTTDFSTELYTGQWPNLSRRLMVANGDRGYTKYDNLIMK